jgi:hypothetical protein
MIRRSFLKWMSLAFTVAVITPVKLFAETVTATLAKSMKISLSSPGRVGFYVDYSELDSVGEHTFYVCRTHGTDGIVSVDFASFGDLHNSVTGTITWADGFSDVKSFKVSVGSKSSGDHRIYVQLANSSGGVVLHNGVKTIAYGVIDDGTVPIDADAVFFDTAAASGGTGKSVSPYNTYADALANLGTKRYLCGRGTITPYASIATDGRTGVEVLDGVPVPPTRTSEETRLYIQAWAGSRLIVDGASVANRFGFYTKTGESFHTYRNIDFTALDTTANTNADCCAIFYHSGGSTDITIELCTADDINGGAGSNTAPYMLWNGDGLKVWRCTSNNIQIAGDNTNQNTAGILYFTTTNISIQRCEFTNSANAGYFKRMEGGIVPTVRFCKIKTANGLRYGFGSAFGLPDYGIVQSNLFKNCNVYQAIQHTGASVNQQGKNWICNNVFDSCGGGDSGAIRSVDTYNHQIFNNVFINCLRAWEMREAVVFQSTADGLQVEYADYNHVFGSIRDLYRYLSIKYADLNVLQNETGFGLNDIIGIDPLFENPMIDDYSYKSGSPCIGTGVGGTNKGLYLLGVEKIGASDEVFIFIPKPPSSLSVT